MLSLNITKHPVVLLANFRTGSSALAQHIAQQHRLKLWLEPFQVSDFARADQHKLDFIKFYTQNYHDGFVLKFMPSQISGFNPYQEILSKPCTVIKLSRRDKAQQIASLYVANQRQKYFKLAGEPTAKFELPFDHAALQLAVRTVVLNDYMLEMLPYTADHTLVYEDIGWIPNTDHTSSDRPTNWNDIVEAVSRVLQWQWNDVILRLSKRKGS